MFKGIGKSVGRKLAALKGAAEFSGTVRDTVRLLYRKNAPKIRDAIFERTGRRANITAASSADAKVLMNDRELLRAALRREGFDVGDIVVR